MSRASAVEDLLFAVLDKPTADERDVFLDSACAGDTKLRRQVEKLLKAHASVGDFLQTPVIEQLTATPVPADVTQAFDASTDHGVGTPARTEGEGASDVEASPRDFLEPSTRPDSLGRLGHYEVLEVLGKGGFGIVYRAFDEQLQRVVAIKVLSPEMAASSSACKRFLREACSTAKVRHGNVVQVYAVEEQPLPYLVMEYIPGETLQQRLERTGPMDVTEVVKLVRQIADGLTAAHAQGLVHRDIKPGNILIESGVRGQETGVRNQESGITKDSGDACLTPDPCLLTPGMVKLTDFGLARAADDASLSQSGILAGTPMYMVPEQASGDRLDQRADLFSLGSVLYTMCSGRPPFWANSTLAVLKRVVEETPRPITEISSEVPPWLCAIIAKLQAKKPEDRFATAREVADLLELQAQMQRTGTVTTAEVGLRSVNAKTEERPAIHLAYPRSVRRSPRWTFWAVAAALLLIGGGIWLYQIIIIRDKDGKEVARIKVPEGGKVEIVEDKKVDPKHTPWAATPEQQIWIDSVARMPLPERLKAVTRKLEENKLPVKLVLEPNDGPPTRCTVAGGNPRAIWPLLALTSLTSLDLTATAVTDFAPLARLPLTELIAHVIVDNIKSEAALKSMTTLKTVNGRPAAEYWAERAVLRKEIDNMAVNASALSLTGRQEWFNSIMKKLNPKWSGKYGSGGLSQDKTNGVITLSFLLTTSDAPVYDFSPVRALGVEAVHLHNTPYLCDLSPLAKSKVQSFRYVRAFGSLRDLSPLAGLPLKDLDLTGATSLTDLSPLAGMKLESFQLVPFSSVTDVKVLQDMPITSLAFPLSVTDLRPFKTMKLTSLGCSATDLAPLAGMPLETLAFRGSRPPDLAPLAGMKLKHYSSIDFNGYWTWFRADYELDEKMFRAMPLVTINLQAAAKFWAAYDADRKALEEFVTATARMAPATAVVAVNEAIKKKGRALDDSSIEDGAVVEVKVSPQIVGKFEFNTLGPLNAFPRVKKITIVDNYHPHWQNLASLMKLPIEEIVCSPATVAGNAIILRQMPTLKTINGKPAQEVLAAVK